MNSRVAVTAGSYALVAVEQPADEDGKPIADKRWLLFVKAWLEPILPPALERAFEAREETEQ